MREVPVNTRKREPVQVGRALRPCGTADSCERSEVTEGRQQEQRTGRRNLTLQGSSENVLSES